MRFVTDSPRPGSREARSDFPGFCGTLHASRSAIQGERGVRPYTSRGRGFYFRVFVD